MANTKNSAESWAYIADLHSRLVLDNDLMDEFEDNPAAFLGGSDFDALYETVSGCKIDLLKSVLKAPVGTRFLTFDYCLSMIAAEGDDPGIDPHVAIAAANVVAIYNAGVIGNAVAYHDVLLGAEVAAGAVAVKVTSTWGQYDSPVLNTLSEQPLTAIELSPSCLEGELHAFFSNSGMGESREKMIIHSAVSKDASWLTDGETIIGYSYRGTDFEIALLPNGVGNKMTVTDGVLK